MNNRRLSFKPNLLLSSRIVLLLCVSFCFSSSQAQVCPPNIDFETGTFAGWKCYIGSTAEVNGQNIISLFESGPVDGRHTMITADPTNPLDAYGGFPINCPNGSGRTVRLGNDQSGTQAEGISYEFTIPAGQNVYTLIYHYAVVFEDPAHEEYQQPRMQIEITNVTDQTIIDCSSFSFIPNGSGLPGFFQSPVQISNAPIWCKDWTAVSINLNGHAGKTIRLFFKSADCTFRRHFGYAYIDVNSECSGEFVGASYCADDTAVHVTAPYGYQSYTWFNNTFTQVLGNQQTISFSPPPPPGTSIAVELIPYNGYGCPDTLSALMIDTMTIRANAGADAVSCNNRPVQIGVNPKPGYVYSWLPAAGLSNPSAANPFANPAGTTTYTLTVRNRGGGCLSTDEVLVRKSILDTTVTVAGKLAYCEGNNDSCILRVTAAGSVQWYKDNVLIPGATQRTYRVSGSGTYHALLGNSDGCRESSSRRTVVIDTPIPGIVYPIQFAVTNTAVQLQARTIGSNALWSPPLQLNNPAIYTPLFTGDEDQIYTITLTTNSGCITRDQQTVKVIPFIDIFVPTGFTPNGDGLNDVLRATLSGIKELRYFKIFNRWGQLIFETANPEAGWNGTINGQQQASQVVVWMAEGTGIDNKIYRRKGTSTLIR